MKSQILTLCLAISTLAFAQKPNREKIESFKVAFLTERLDLSPSEAQSFWPVYNQFQDEMRTHHEARRQQMEQFGPAGDGLNSMSEDEIKKELDKELTREENIVKLRRKYHQEFLRVLSAKKVAKLYAAEMQFERKLVERLRKGRDREAPRGPRSERPERMQDGPPPHNE